MQRKARGVRKRLKASDPERYYEERTRLWDEQHEKSAAGVKLVLEMRLSQSQQTKRNTMNSLNATG